MNIFNRVLIVFALLVMMAVFTVICIAPELILTSTGEWLADWGEYLGQNSIFYPGVRLLLGIGAAFVIDVILLLCIFLEVKPRRKRYIDIQLVSGGDARVSLTSVEDQVQYKLDSLPGVIRVGTKTRAKGKRVTVAAFVTINREAQVTQTADHLVNTIQDVITEDMGLQMAGQPSVRLEIIDTPVVAKKNPPRRSNTPATPILPPEAVSTTQTLPPALPESIAKPSEES